MFIWVRRTTEWADEEAFRAQLRDEFRPLVDLWDATFTMPYHAFRHEVRQIARENHARVEGARCAALDEIPHGALVLPVDDDDWFDPAAARVLAGSGAAEAGGARWPSLFLEVDVDLSHTLSRTVRRALPGVGPKWPCTTNNYALVKREGVAPLLASHVKASRWLREDRERMLAVERPLSLMNRSLASQTSLRRHRRPVDRAALVRKHARYRTLYERAPAAAPWAADAVARMRALMLRLEVAS